MAVTADRVVVELEAKVAEYNRKIDSARAASDKAFDTIGKAANDAERQTVSSMGRAATSAERAMARIAGAARTGRDAVGGFRDGFKQGLSEAIRDAGDSATATGTAFGFLKGAVGGFVASLGAQALVSFTLDVLDMAGGLGEAAQQLGVTTEQLQVYRYAASQAGISQDEMDQGLAKLSKSLGDAALGAAQDTKVFDILGISIKDTNGQVKTAGEVLPEIADALAQIPDPATRAALEMQIFGRAGQKLDPLLAGGREAIDNLTNAARSLGVVLSDEQIQNADRTADKLSELKVVLSANVAGAVANNAAAIYDLANSMVSLAASIPNAIDRIRAFRHEAALYLADQIDNDLWFLPQSFRGTAGPRANAQRGLRQIEDERRRRSLSNAGPLVTPGRDALGRSAPARAPAVGDLSTLLAPTRRARSGGAARAGAGSRVAEIKAVTLAMEDLQSATLDALQDVERLLSVNGQEESDRAAKRFYAALGIDPLGDFRKDMEDYEQSGRPTREGQDSYKKREEKLQERDKRIEEMKPKIDELAGYFETAFVEGSDGLWRSFKRQGISVIAELLAKLVLNPSSISAGGGIGGLAAGGGLFGSALGSIVGSIFGRASGGYVGPGQTVRVNEGRGGVELLRMGSQGGQVIPLGQTRAARPTSGSVTNIYQIDASNSVLPARFARDILQEADRRSAGRSVQAGRAAAEASPSVIQRRQVLGS